MAKSYTLGALNLSTFDVVNGLELKVHDVDGWGAPATTLDPQQKPRGHGAWSGDSYLRPRILVIKGSIKGYDEANVRDALDRLYSACDLAATTLAVTEAGRTLTCRVRQQDEIIPKVINATHVQYSMQVVADDPRKYGPTQVVSTGLPFTSGGLVGPLLGPLISGASTASGFVSIFNDGNMAAPLTVRFDGPVVGPSVAHIQSGRIWAAAGSALLATEFWTVSQPSRVALAQGTTARARYVTNRGRFELQPGQNDFLFGADAYSASALMTVTAASARK